MKVVKNNFEEKKVWHIVCSQCDSILEYDKSDVNIKESRFFYLHWIVCPCCNSNIDVKHW